MSSTVHHIPDCDPQKIRDAISHNLKRQNSERGVLALWAEAAVEARKEGDRQRFERCLDLMECQVTRIQNIEEHISYLVEVYAKMLKGN